MARLNRSWLGLAAMLFAVCPATFAQQHPAYHLAQKITLGGDGGWDYFEVEQITHEILIPRVSHLMIVEPDGKIGADIAPLHGAHAVITLRGLHKGFISNGSQHSVTMFDTETRKVLGDVPLPGLNSDGLIYEGKSGYVFALNGHWDGAKNGWSGTNATAIDADAGKVVGAVELPGKPEAAQSDGKGNIFVNIESTDSIVQIDAKALKIINTWPLKPCSGPSGIAIDKKNQRLFAGCRNRMMAVLDYTTGKVVATFPIGGGVDATRFDPGTGLVFASNGEGNITVAHQEGPNDYSVVQTIQTVRGARTMALDLKSHRIYTISADFAPPPAPTPDRPRPGPTPITKTVTLYVFEP